MPMPSHSPHPTPGRTALLLCLLLASLTACQTVSPLPPVDLAQPGWQLHHGQAVWRHAHQGTELAGDLLVASRPDGHTVLEFTKASWPMVVVRLTPNAWQLESASTGRRHSGRGSPPARSAWLVLPDCLAGLPPPAGWHFAPTEEGWALEHPRTGEQLHGYLLP